MIDQRKLPGEEVYVECADHEQVAQAIETMVIRGAPAIGVAAAYGIVLGVMGWPDDSQREERFVRVYRRLEETRPTARNLFWALEQMRDDFAANRTSDLAGLQRALLDRAQAIEQEDLEMCRRIGGWGKALV